MVVAKRINRNRKRSRYTQNNKTEPVSKICKNTPQRDVFHTNKTGPHSKHGQPALVCIINSVSDVYHVDLMLSTFRYGSFGEELRWKRDRGQKDKYTASHMN